MGFHKRYIKLVTKLDKSKKFEVTLIGFDGTKKIELDKLYTKKIFDIVDKMPMNKLIKDKKFKPLNLSLFSDYKPETTLKGLGFKDAKTARDSIKIIKNSNRKHAHKVQAMLVMIQRAKVALKRTSDPKKKKNLRAAIKAYEPAFERLKKKQL